MVTFPADLAQFGVQLNTPMTTPTSCDTADHQFLVQEAILDDVISVQIGYFPANLDPLGSRSIRFYSHLLTRCRVFLQLLYKLLAASVDCCVLLRADNLCSLQ